MQLVVENRKLQQWKESLFFIGMFSLVAVVVWITVSVSAQFGASNADPEITKLIKPINPNLNVNLIGEFASERTIVPDTFTITVQSIDGDAVSNITLDPFAGE